MNKIAIPKAQKKAHSNFNQFLVFLEFNRLIKSQLAFLKPRDRDP